MMISIFLSIIAITFAHEFFFKDLSDKIDFDKKEQ
jgi:hypothetical protein